MAFLELRGVHKGYGDAARRNLVLNDINLAVEEGELLAIVGYSGAGKSTLVQIIAGLMKPDGGTVELGGKPITGPGPDRGIVFQGDSLLPWLTAHENIYLAVDRVFPRFTPAEKKARTERYLALVKLQDAHHKRPHELSGGMRQRVAVARALAQDPQVLLMDEPFSALDALTRGTLQDEVRRICLETGQTAFMITHDVDEAIYLADKIFLMTNGPGAVLAEVVENPLPKDRGRTDLHRHPLYYALRNHIIDFLVTRSKTFAAEKPDHDPRNVPVVHIGKPGLTVATGGEEQRQTWTPGTSPGLTA
jgi:nitrate/nitrite transport system ATP-binding protein